MSADYDDVGFIISSQYRVAVIETLEADPATPSTIAEESDLTLPHISRAIRRLRDRGDVELLVDEDRRKGRIYGLTDQGEALYDKLQTVNGGDR